MAGGNRGEAGVVRWPGAKGFEMPWAGRRERTGRNPASGGKRALVGMGQPSGNRVADGIQGRPASVRRLT